MMISQGFPLWITLDGTEPPALVIGWEDNNDSDEPYPLILGNNGTVRRVVDEYYTLFAPEVPW